MGDFYGATSLQCVDDCVGVEAEESILTVVYANLGNLVAELGLQGLPDKLCPPSSRVHWGDVWHRRWHYQHPWWKGAGNHGIGMWLAMMHICHEASVEVTA